MNYIKGVTFGWMARKGDFLKEEAKQSLRLLKERTGADTVIMALAALQETAQSEEIDYTGDHMVSDEELEMMIRYAQSLGLRVIMKPAVNCRNGTWRAHINFFDLEVPCEPKWSNWFRSYTAYQVHYAKLAQRMGCEMFIIGCEMVQTERREAEWRQAVREVRKHFSGPITYNTDKYQESNVSWWDELDIISSSGYYPIDDWDNQLARIKQVVDKYRMPFFFAEAGCMSTEGSAHVPNDWGLPGGISLEEQAQYYEVMTQKLRQHPWVEGIGVWDWSALLYKADEAGQDRYYALYNKPAEKVLKAFFERNLERIHHMAGR